MGTAVATPGNEDNVTICHRTNSVSNPYVVITVDPSAVDGDLGNDKGRGDHYAEHVGPVFDPEADYPKPMSGDEWGDIIPPIEGVHGGLNWNAEGIAIYENDCTVPGPVTSSPPVSSSAPASSSAPVTTSPPVTTSVETTPPVDEKVTLCHRTNSVTNPYVVITVSVSAADGDASNDKGQGDHYLEHTGPVFDPDVDYQPPFSGDEWGDIIPPIDGVHDGLNWTEEGIALYENDCAVPTPTETQTTITATPTTSSAEPTTSSAEPTTSTAEPTTEISSPPGPATTSSPADTTVTITDTPSSAAALPKTGPGAPLAGAIGISLLLIGVGVLLLLGPGRLMPVTYHRKH